MTTANLRIVPKNDYDDAVLTVSAAAVVGFEVENTQNTIRDKALRTTSNAAYEITGVWPTNRTVSHASMHRHLNHAGSWQLRLFSDAGASSLVLDATGGAVSATSYTPTEPYVWSEGSTDPFRSKSPTWKWFAETLARSFKINLSGTPAQAYWLVSRIWIGRYFEVAINPDYGLELAIGDLTDSERTQGGSQRTNLSETWRSLKFDLGGIEETEYATWTDIFDYAGTGRDVLISAFPGDATRTEALHTIAGRFQNLNAIGRQVNRLTGRVQIADN